MTTRIVNQRGRIETLADSLTSRVRRQGPSSYQGIFAMPPHAYRAAERCGAIKSARGVATMRGLRVVIDDSVTSDLVWRLEISL